MSIAMNEIIKILFHAEAQHVWFFRLGTSGGVGVCVCVCVHFVCL